MNRTSVLALLACVALAACDNSQPKQAAGPTPPARAACTTPEQAGLKAQDITHKLVEARKQGKITPEQYASLNNTMSEGFRAWAERQDLKAYCGALSRVATDAGF